MEVFTLERQSFEDPLDPFMYTGMTVIMGSSIADLKLYCGDSLSREGIIKCLHRPNSIMWILTEMLFSHESKRSIKSEGSSVQVESKWATA